MSGQREFDRTNTATLFNNDDKDNPNDPKQAKWADRKGSATLQCPHCGGGFEMWVSGWVKTAKASGQKFLSLAFSPKEQKRNTAPRGVPDFQAPRQPSRGRDEDFI
jgi:uncharacterized C2H2 Zn-finger protein